MHFANFRDASYSNLAVSYIVYGGEGYQPPTPPPPPPPPEKPPPPPPEKPELELLTVEWEILEEIELPADSIAALKSRAEKAPTPIYQAGALTSLNS